MPASPRVWIYLTVWLLLSSALAPHAWSQQPAPRSTPVRTRPDPNGSSPRIEAPAAQAGQDAAPGSPWLGRAGALALLKRVNPMIWVLVLCSIFTIGLIFERLIALRRERVVPREFAERFLERLGSGKLDRDRAVELCRAHDSPAARISALAVSYWGRPATEIRQTLEADAGGIIADLKRNVRALNGVATLAPLLGLLGTVIGLIQSFDALGGRVGASKGEALAQGISLALVSTAVGLTIAAVAVVAYYFFLNRIDLLARLLDDHARRVIELVAGETLRPSAPAMHDRRASGAVVDPARFESRPRSSS